MRDNNFDFEKVKPLLPHVMKPGRYIGNEKNSYHKELCSIRTRICLVFPDVYEIGMSNSGLDILYSTINNSPYYYAERAFAPWVDFSKLLRQNNLPLYSLETKTPLNEFDIIGISLQYERLYTNVLNILELSKIPLHRKERGENDPIILAGGPGTVNPEPMSDFIDLFHIGDADQSIMEIMDVYSKIKQKDLFVRKNAILALSELKYIYNPEMFDDITNIPIKKTAKKNIYYGFNQHKTNYSYIVPNITPVQDKGVLQVSRGCVWGCRFCQAGMIDRPVREKSVDLLKAEALELINKTGTRELSFNSLSIADYSRFPELINEVIKLQERGINIGLPSLRVDTYNLELAKTINSIRKTGLTFAIEAGDMSARKTINKNVDEDKLFETIKSALDAGWRVVKLYFMIGLPFVENEAENILNISEQLVQIGKSYRLKRFINLSINAFVPKPFTPFQWCGMESLNILKEKLNLLKSKINKKYINLKWNSIELSLLEGALARADRSIGKVIRTAYDNGAIFEGWDEMFSFNIWKKAFQKYDLSLEQYATRIIAKDSILPWEKINLHVSREFLLSELNKAQAGEITTNCMEKGCHNCGEFEKTCHELITKPENLKEDNHNILQKIIINNKVDNSFPVNIFYSRFGLLKFISHLDMINIWEKIIRMLSIPVNYTQGFNMHAKITYSSPNPVGIQSFCEWIRLDLKEYIKPEKLEKIISSELFEGFKINSVDYFRSPVKTFKFVRYIISPSIPIELVNVEKLNFPLQIESEDEKIKLLVPYPEPLGIYRLLEKITGKEKIKLLDYEIVKDKLLL